MFSRGLAGLFSRFRGRGGEAENQELPETELSEGAMLGLQEVGGGLVCFGSPLLGSCLFTVRCRRTGGLQEESGGGALVPMEKGTIRARFQGAPVEPRPAAAVLIRSVSRKEEGCLRLEFTAAEGSREWTWTFEVDPALEITQVSAAGPLPSLFDEVPSVAEMARFLHALTHHQRSTLRTLQSVVRTSGSPRARQAMPLLEASWPSGEAVRNPAIPSLVEAFEKCGRRMNANSLEAFGLLVDLETGAATVEAMAEDLAARGFITVTPGAALAVADIFGVTLDGRVWQETLSDLGDFETARLNADGPEVQSLVGHLRSSRRTVLDILDDLGHDGGSRRVVSLVAALRPLVPQGLLRVNDEQQALLPLLEASGRRVHSQTLVALCLFADIEAGNLAEDMAPRLASEADRQDTSMYAMMAAAGAFGLSLEAWCLEWDAARDPLPILADLAAGAEGGLLACFRRRGEEGRWWEWLRSREDAGPTRTWGMEFTGILLARFAEPSGLPVRSVEPGQLRGVGESLSRGFLAVRKLQEAIRRVVPRPVDRASLRRHPEVLEAALQWLLSGAAGAVLDGMVHPDTRKVLVQEARREIGRDFLVLRGAARATPEALGLHLILALCLSPEVNPAGSFKQFDEKRIRAVLADRVTGMLESEDPALRALGATLSASRDHVPDRATRMLAEYHLGVARQDPDPQVAEAALDGLVRLALMDFRALPDVVEIGATSPDALEAPEEGPSRLQEASLNQAMADLQEWLAGVAESDPLRPMGMPITDGQGLLDPVRARPIAEILAGVHQASKGDGSLGAVRIFALSSLDELSAVAGSHLESWRMLARSVGRDLADLDPGALALDHRLLVEEQSGRLLHQRGALPHLGGRGRPVTLYRTAAGRSCGIWCMRERLPGQFVREESPFFRDLLEMYRRVEGSRIRVLRLRLPLPLPDEFGVDRPTLVSERSFPLREVEVLDPQRVDFLPAVRLMALHREQLGLDSEPWEDVRAAAALAEGRRPEARKEPAREAPSAPEEPCPGPAAVEGAAEALGRALELDEDRRLEVARLLSEAFADQFG